MPTNCRFLGPCGLTRLVLVVLGLSVLRAAAAESMWARPASLVNERGMLRVEGRPRFILGMYENPRDDTELEEAVQCGFNLFQCPPEAAALDRLRRVGAFGWVNLGGALDLSAQIEARAAQLTEVVERLREHPALLVWEGPDEILWNQWWVPLETLRGELRGMAELAGSDVDLAGLARRTRECLDRGLYRDFQRWREAFWRKAGKPCPNPGARVDDAPDRVRAVGDGITAGIRLVHQLDRQHVVWLNHAPRNSLDDLRWFNREADMAGCDIYPVPANLAVGHSDLTDRSLSSVGAYTRRMREVAPGRACAMVLQGFGWRDLRDKVTEHELALGIGRPPSFAESRFMAYDAILHGANAILYWGTAYLKPTLAEGLSETERPQLWRDLLRLGCELRALEPALVAPPIGGPAIRAADTFGSHEVPALVATLREVQGEFVLVVANESSSGLAFAVEQLPARLNDRVLHRLQSDEQHRVMGGRIADGIRAADVQVYATSRRFEPEAK